MYVCIVHINVWGKEKKCSDGLQIIHLCMYVSQPYRFRFVHMYVSVCTYILMLLFAFISSHANFVLVEWSIFFSN